MMLPEEVAGGAALDEAAGLAAFGACGGAFPLMSLSTGGAFTDPDFMKPRRAAAAAAMGCAARDPRKSPIMVPTEHEKSTRVFMVRVDVLCHCWEFYVIELIYVTDNDVTNL